MTSQNADRARRVGAELGKDCSSRIARPGDHREPISLAEAFAVVDHPLFCAGWQLAWQYLEPEIERRVADQVEELRRVDRDLGWSPAHAELQRRRREYRGPNGRPARAQSPAAIRARAEWSWRRAEWSWRRADRQVAG